MVDKSNDKDLSIQNLAIAKTSWVCNWTFVPTGNLYIDDCGIESYVGGLEYNNPNYEVGMAIKMRNWVFVLERMTNDCRNILASTNNPQVWVIAGFYGQAHYSFLAVKEETTEELNLALLRYVMEKMIPILHQELFDSSLCNEISSKRKPMAYEITPFKK